MNRGSHWNQPDPRLGGAKAEKNDEIEEAVRALVRTLRGQSDKSLLIVVDADGTFAYEPVPREDLNTATRALLAFHALLERRSDVRAKTFGTEQG